MNNPPAFQFYADDFIGGTVHMTAQEVGAYIRLLCYQWGHGKAPVSKDAIDRVAGCVVSSTVLDKFRRGKNPRLEQERRKQIEYRAKQAINGAKGGRPEKRLGLGLANSGLTQTKAKKSSPSPSPSPSGTLSVELPVGFPKTEEEAASLGDMVGVPKEFSVSTWNLAAGRGGRDSKDVPIRDFRRHLKAAHNFHQSREVENRHRGNGGADNSQPLTDAEILRQATQ